MIDIDVVIAEVGSVLDKSFTPYDGAPGTFDTDLRRTWLELRRRWWAVEASAATMRESIRKTLCLIYDQCGDGDHVDNWNCPADCRFRRVRDDFVACGLQELGVAAIAHNAGATYQRDHERLLHVEAEVKRANEEYPDGSPFAHIVLAALDAKDAPNA